jgi:SAM-dependent methyltransferase
MWDQEKWNQEYSLLKTGHIVPLDQALPASKAEAAAFRAKGLIFEGAHVLDTGCGHGRSAIGMLEHNIGSYTGLDVIPESIAFCRRAFSALPNFSFHQLDVYNELYNPQGRQQATEIRFPIEDESFDAVVAGSLYTHLGTKTIAKHYLQESWRTLKPGGRIFCSWFRSPPNVVTESHQRTALAEGDILDIVTEFFHVYACYGGDRNDYHNQWCLYGRKKSPISDTRDHGGDRRRSSSSTPKPSRSASDVSS